MREQELDDSEQRSRLLADNMSQLAWTCDLLGNLTWHNRRWLDYTGLSFQDTKGRDWAMVQHPDHGARIIAHVRRVGETGEPWEDTFPLRGRDGQYRWFVSRAVAVRDDHGQIDGVLLLASDVTDEVAAGEQMLELRREAAAANRAKDEFLTMLSHELRNPLAPILTALEIMRLRGTQSREQDILERQVGRLTRLVDDLLDASRITRGMIELRKQDIEIADVVVEAIEIASPLLEQREHQLDVRIPRRGLGVRVDPHRMAQVILNLLTNAAKYSDRGSKVIIEATREDACVRIRVVDEGVGIAPEMLGTVFDQFVQHRQPLDRSQGGLGLGLAIVRSFVNLHGGTVRVESEGAGAGSAFIIELPAVALAPAVTQAEDEAAREAETRSEPAGRMRILVVDDNEDAVETLKEALEHLGYRVEVAHDGPSALKVAAEFNPDIALLDIGLPVMDGYELARRLRESPGVSPELHLVAVTGYGQDADRQRSATAGFEKHLVKPVDLKGLARVVEELR